MISEENDLLSTNKSTLLDKNRTTPLASVGRVYSRKGYVDSDSIKELAVDKYKNKNRKGITYQDLMDRGLAIHKRQAQDMLKYHLKKGTLFTLRDTRPQQYFPSIMRSEIIKNELDKNTPIDPTGVTYSANPHSFNSLDQLTLQTLEGHILPLLPAAPLFIHNIHLKLKIAPECYVELKLPTIHGNRGQKHSEVIATSRVDYIFYPSGTVIVEIRCSNHPFKLQTEGDRSRLLVFFGQLKQALTSFLMDSHERLVPEIMHWELTECDINKDIKVSHWFHYVGSKIQVKHLDHLFCLYIKSMGEDTVYRVEERKHPKKNAIEAINDIFNPSRNKDSNITCSCGFRRRI